MSSAVTGLTTTTNVNPNQLTSAFSRAAKRKGRPVNALTKASRKENAGGSPKLSSGSARNALADAAFAGPGRTYPIPDKPHARNALARASGKSVEGRVRAAVKRKFPSIK